MIHRTRRFLGQHKWLKRVLLFFFVWISGHIAFLLLDGLANDPDTTDIAIVLGNRVYSDGRLASWTEGRVKRALDLYREGKVKKIFVSGGLGIEDHYPEGKAMKAWLLQRGVPDSNVVEDNEEANTYLTAVNFLKWNKARGYKSVTVVSQFYHITRTKYILRKAGFEGKIESASSRYYRFADAWGTVREVPAFYKYLLVY